MLAEQRLRTDIILWIVFVVAAVAEMVLDRVAPYTMAAWGWVLILIALLAGLGALAWPLFSDGAGSEPATVVLEAQTGEQTRAGQPPVAEAATMAGEPQPDQAEGLPERVAAAPDSDLDINRP